MGTDGTTRAQIGINFYPVVPDIKGRACQRINASPVILAFIGNIKRFVLGKFEGIGVQGAYLFGYDHGYAFIINGLFDGLNAFLYLVRFNNGHMFNPDGSHNLFDGYPAESVHVYPGHVNAGVGLMTGHGSDAVIENHQGDIVVVLLEVHKAGCIQRE